MILLHDIVEIDAGDTFMYSDFDLKKKAEKEMKAAERIFGLLPEKQAAEFKEIWKEFEEAKTSEAAFAQAMDSFMPILHNYRTNGQQWKKHGISRDEVLSRNRKVERGSTILWDYIVSIVDDAVEKGFLNS